MSLESDLELLYEAAKSEAEKMAGFKNPANIKESLNKLVEISKKINAKEIELIELINREN